MQNEHRRTIQNEFGEILNRVKRKTWSCIEYGCENHAINSHLLQRNGILNYVAENGKVVMIEPISIFGLNNQNSPIEFKKIGIKEALSYDVFCSHHDVELFKEIEDGHFDSNNYRHCALFYYRTISAESRLKEIEIEKYEAMLDSEVFNEFVPSLDMQLIYGQKLMMTYSRMEIDAYRSWIYDDLHNNTENFIFESFEIPINGIFASTISSLFLTENELTSLDIPQYLFIQIIPKETNSLIMFGYHKQHKHVQYESYIERWRSVTKDNIGYMLTGLLIQSNQWGMSPSLYERLAPTNIDKYKSLFLDDCRSLNQTPNESFNLFEGIF